MSGHECAPCGRQFRLYQHYRDHLIHSTRHYYCTPCHRDFVSQDALDSHLRNSERHLNCEWCQTAVGTLRIHNQRHHEQCSKCKQWFKDAIEVHRHYCLAHAELYCVPCRKLVGNTNELKMHCLSSAHRPINVECAHPACGRFFISKAALVQHLEAGTCLSRVNLAEVDHYFSRHADRGQRFVRSNLILPASLDDIFRDDYGRYMCHLCPKSFRHKGEIISHLRSSKHKNRGQKAYKCPSDRCEKAEFYSLSNLMIHLDNSDCDVSYARELDVLVNKLLDVLERL
ncbi:hypothetical protein PTTG_06506 [Puccinia triticina 1-1 BBBD Race 1]|uniref:C2H2-type domain-containing protein n=2 Tax=Puccinia triticina TaxID=208348 RepID=A0A0C4F090_PUCT1|nr:hypothetical protein PTTG_06506 [Puccinia triticina 1-1 BBBD Race 1]